MRFSDYWHLAIPVLLGCRLISPARAEDQAVVVDRPDPSSPNDHYAGNRPPLLPSPLIKLPTGSIKPRGWLRKQLELEADGFTGHLTEISGFCRKEGNAWLNPKGEGGATWEEVYYWFRGFIALGYTLDDPRIIKESQPWIENLFATQQADGYFGPPKNRGDEKRGPDLMPNMNGTRRNRGATSACPNGGACCTRAARNGRRSKTPAAMGSNATSSTL